MRIAPIRPLPPRPAPAQPAREVVRGTAVVPVGAPTRATRPAPVPLRRPDPAVVAQLLAARDGLPQARDRRRASPAEAVAAYGAAARLRVPVCMRTADEAI